jgi:hypothetical protein
MKRFTWLLAAVLVAVAAALVAGPSFSNHDVAKGFDPSKMTDEQEALLSGFLSSEISPSGTKSNGPKQFGQKGNGACSGNFGSNVKVNQNCLNITDPDLQGRGQAENETAIAIDPNDSTRVVASENDYRRGDGSCGTQYSTDGGSHWFDSAPPMGFTRGTPFLTAREYWQSGGDTSVSFDTKGNAYLSCQVFNRGRTASPNPTSRAASSSSARRTAAPRGTSRAGTSG